MKFYDDGKEVNQELVPKPTLCTTCASEGRFCVQIRFDQKDEDEFVEHMCQFSQKMNPKRNKQGWNSRLNQMSFLG